MSEASFASLGPTLLARKGGAKPAMRPQLAPLPENSAEIAALADEQLEDLGWNDMGSEESDSNDFANNAFDPMASRPEQDLIVSKAPKKAALETTKTHEIIDPLNGADIVSLADHKNKPNAANEDTPEIESPLVARQQKRLAERVLADAVPVEEEADAPAPTQLLRKKSGEPKNAAQSSKSAASKSASKRRAAFTLRLDTERHLKLRLAATMQGVSAQSIVTEALDAMLEDIEDLDALVDRMKLD